MGMKTIDDWWVVVVISAGIIFSSSAIMAPVLIRFGLGAGITVAVLGGVILLVTGVILDNLTPTPEWGQVWWPYLYLALCLVFYTASLPVSIRFYERRDH